MTETRHGDGLDSVVLDGALSALSPPNHQYARDCIVIQRLYNKTTRLFCRVQRESGLTHSYHRDIADGSSLFDSCVMKALSFL
jgi:hypothetical protein